MFAGCQSQTECATTDLHLDVEDGQPAGTSRITFSGFDLAAVAPLGELPSWSVDEFAARKRQLSDGISGPGRALITDLAARLDADLSLQPRASVSPLHRDLRFAPVASARYKDHLLLTTCEGSDRRISPTLRIRIDGHQTGLESGFGFTPALQERWRAAVGGKSGASPATDLGHLVEGRRAEIAGERTKNVPGLYGSGHPRSDLLRLTGF